MDHSLGALLAQTNDEGAQQAIYYLNRILIVAESRYNSVKKDALLSSSSSRRHDITWSDRPFMSFQESILYGFLWQSQFLWIPHWLIGHIAVPIWHDLLTQKAIKGQALVDFLTAHPVSETSKLHENIPDEVIEANMASSDDVWQMFFDGALRTGSKGKIITRMGVIFVSPENHVLPRALTEPCSNNVVEHNALLIGL